MVCGLNHAALDSTVGNSFSKGIIESHSNNHGIQSHAHKRKIAMSRYSQKLGHFISPPSRHHNKPIAIMPPTISPSKAGIVNMFILERWFGAPRWTRTIDPEITYYYDFRRPSYRFVVWTMPSSGLDVPCLVSTPSSFKEAWLGVGISASTEFTELFNADPSARLPLKVSCSTN